MQSLPLLIRLARRATDEHKTELGRVGAAQRSLEASIQAHDARTEQEAEAAAQDLAALAAYAGWAGKAARDRAGLLTRRQELQQNETAARESLRAAFIDQKRLEVARETRERESRADAIRQAETRLEEQQIVARVAEPV